jgi:hypothetical protein
MADGTDSFIREVQEDLRREQLMKVWERYGTYIIAAAVLLVLSVAAYKYNEYRRISAAEAAGGRYEAAIKLAQSGKADEARKAFETIADTSSGGYATLAGLRLAGTAAKDGRTADAIIAYDAVAKGPRGASDDLLRDYASLQAAMLKLDTADWTDMQNRLNDLTNDKNPWRFSARELLGLAAYKAGRMEDARKSFEQLLGDKGTPPSLLERTQLMLNMLAEAEAAKGSGAASQGQAGKASDQPGTAPQKTQ